MLSARANNLYLMYTCLLFQVPTAPQQCTIHLCNSKKITAMHTLNNPIPTRIEPLNMLFKSSSTTTSHCIVAEITSNVRCKKAHDQHFKVETIKPLPAL